MFWNFVQMIMLIPMLDSNFDSNVAAFIARFKFVLFIFDPSHCKLIFLWLLIIACNYNINTIEVDNTVKHYGCLIGLDDNKPLNNLEHLLTNLAFVFSALILTNILMVWCLSWKCFRMENQNKEQYSPTMYKWSKIYEALKFSIYIRVFVQVLMTIVLISHPLCKLTLSFVLSFYPTNIYSTYSFW